MRAVRFHEYGGPEVLKLEDIPEPEPLPDEVVVRVRAVGLNHVDIDMRDGTSRLPLTLPHTLGFEVGGDIAALGADVSGWSVGDRVTPLYQVACRNCAACLAGDQQHCKTMRDAGRHAPGRVRRVHGRARPLACGDAEGHDLRAGRLDADHVRHRLALPRYARGHQARRLGACVGRGQRRGLGRDPGGEARGRARDHHLLERRQAGAIERPRAPT